MPESKKRVHQQQPQNQNYKTHHPRSRQPNRAVLVGVIFFALLGMGITYFIGNGNIAWIVGGAITGAVAGYLFGQQINKTISKR